MFVYSLRASTLKFFAVMVLAVASVVCLALFVPSYGEVAEAGSEIVYEGIRTEADRLSLLSRHGYTVKETPIEQATFTLPEEFDRALASYNELQKEQGLDLSRYKKKTLSRYTYEVQNYEGYEGTVYVNLILFHDRVVAADVCSADPTGFVKALFVSTVE